VTALSFEAGRGDIDHIRLIQRPVTTRLLIDLPGAPGLPLRNEGLADLFETVVPYAEFHDEWSHRELIGALSQLKVSASSYYPMHRSRSGAYPMTFQDRTLREIFEAYHQLEPEVEPFVDHRALEIRFDSDHGFFRRVFGP
jgi:hypothetical protein